MKDFLSFLDLDPAELSSLVDQGLHIKNFPDDYKTTLSNRYIGLLFFLPSTRTRLSFERAIEKMGGLSQYYAAQDLQLKNGESLSDTASVLSQYLDAIVIRKYDMNTYGQGREDLITFCENASVPVINALDCKEHPCQVLADLITLKERWQKSLHKKTVLLTWGYSRRQKSLGVPHSWLLGASSLGMKLRVAHPKEFDLDPSYVEKAQDVARQTGATLEFSNNLDEACEGVDCIYVKNWKSLTMGSEQERQYKESIRENWRVDDACFEKANLDAVYMDCLPSIAGEEATESVRKGQQSIILEQAHNRIYANQSILSRSLGRQASIGIRHAS